MALCHNCDDARNEYVGNGVQKEYQITFEYADRNDVAVGFWNKDLLVWETVPNTDWVFQHDTLIRFNDAPAYGQKLIIYRCTDLNPMPAEFYPGTSIKAQDLNDNFFVLKSAIEEVRCAISRSEDKSEEKYWDKVDDTITYEDQINGQAESKLDDEHVFDAAAISVRHDNYVSDAKPADLPYEQPGKIWWDTDDLLGRWWDPNIGSWVSYGVSGPAGPPGDFGPPGRMIISDVPPIEYPAIGSNAARPLEAGDLWFDSYNVLMYVYYIDNHGPGQWVSVTKTGPAGQDGTDGVDGGNFPDAPADGTIYGRRNNDWEEVSTFSGDYNDLTNQPNLFSGDYNDLTNQPTLFSGDYNDLTNQPTIGDGTITIRQGGVTKGSFTTNQVTGSTINIDAVNVPIASASQLGVIKVGDNLDIEADGTLNAVIPAGLTYKGTWFNATNPPSPAVNGDFYIWDGADGVTLGLNWGSASGEVINAGDRLFYDGTSWAIIPGGGGSEITGTAPVVVSPVVNGEQNVSMPAANATTDGYMPKEAWAKLDGIQAGAEVNVDPTQVYAAAPGNGTLTLTPGGDATVIPLVDNTNAGLMSPAQFSKLDGIEAGAEVNVDPTQTYTASPTNGTLTLTPGGDTTVIPLATPTDAGLMSSADKQRVDVDYVRADFSQYTLLP